ncbi:Lrp/AsnC family transcriptional regulator, partial [Streptomyces clavuligerus]|uniref:Lrp/AsnC family transcriptional regulator n=1 Tax=Streptomyces clavuligerus TaxID=1901 RepID=UPI003F686E23
MAENEGRTEPGTDRGEHPGAQPHPQPCGAAAEPAPARAEPTGGRADGPGGRAELAAARPEPIAPPRPLDAIDRSILGILESEGRASIRSVADRVHVSRANAYARINRLMDDGVIRGFGARVDHERAGQGASAYITLKIVQNSWRTVREQLRALPGAAHIALVSGDFDVLLLVHTPDNRTLRELVLTRLQSIPEVLSTRTLLVFEETDLPAVPPAAPAAVRGRCARSSG